MRTLDAVSRKSRNNFLEGGHTDGSRAQVQLSIPMSQPSFLERVVRGAAIHDPEHTLYPSDTGDKYLKQVVSPTSHGHQGGGSRNRTQGRHIPANNLILAVRVLAIIRRHGKHPQMQKRNWRDYPRRNPSPPLVSRVPYRCDEGRQERGRGAKEPLRKK